MADHGGGSIPFRNLSAAVVSVSDTRDASSDLSGALIEEGIRGAGCTRVERFWVADEEERIRDTVERLILRQDFDVILTTGGTGPAPRDVTPEAVKPLLDKELPGFGELFRSLSYDEIDARAILSRAFAGAAGRKALFALPGSTKAVALALDRLILPVLPHLMELLRSSASKER